MGRELGTNSRAGLRLLLPYDEDDDPYRELLEEELKQEDDEISDELFKTGFFTGGLDDSGDEVFQLPMPE